MHEIQVKYGKSKLSPFNVALMYYQAATGGTAWRKYLYQRYPQIINGHSYVLSDLFIETRFFAISHLV